MGNCRFNIGSIVMIRAGRCGTVIDKITGVSGITMLAVQFSDGNVGIFDCRRAESCTGNQPTPSGMCGANTLTGSTCSRLVTGGGHCWQHQQ